MASSANVLEAVVGLVEATREQTATMKELTEAMKEHKETMKEFAETMGMHMETMKEPKEMIKEFTEKIRGRKQNRRSVETPEVVVLSDDSAPPSPKRQKDDACPPTGTQGNEHVVQSFVSSEITAKTTWNLSQDSSLSSSSNRRCCVFCGRSHRSDDCTSFPTLEERKLVVVNRDLCWTCGSSRATCMPHCKYADAICKRCNLGKHWEPLCPDREETCSRRNN